MSTDAQASTFPSGGVPQCTAPASATEPVSGVRGPSTARSGEQLSGLLEIAKVGFQLQWEDADDKPGSESARFRSFIQNTADELEILQAAMGSDQWAGDDQMVQDRIAIVVAKMRAVGDLLAHLKGAGK